MAADRLTPKQRFDYIWSRVKQHAENIDMGAEELAAILISSSAQSLASTKVELQHPVATFIADYLAAKAIADGRAQQLRDGPLVKPLSLAQGSDVEATALDGPRDIMASSMCTAYVDQGRRIGGDPVGHKCSLGASTTRGDHALCLRCAKLYDDVPERISFVPGVPGPPDAPQPQE